ncbi:lactate dehydrogenase [Parasalinivibrio latis]|uniref:transposase n=1 Tax=Parasalinivibrio latis TaxID=2952610 RepID=UPI0030E4CA75
MQKLALPEPAGGLQLNFCKTLACRNFGLSDNERYALQRTNPLRPVLVCNECGAFPPLLNNQSVLDVKHRLEIEHQGISASCNNSGCENHHQPQAVRPENYHAFGFSGKRQRYRCKACATTFVDPWSVINPKLDIQQQILGLLFTGYTVREICRRLHINPKSCYDHLRNIAKRCRYRLAITDTKVLNKRDSLTLSSYLSPLQTNAENGVLWLSTTETDSGYVITDTLNHHDAECGSKSVEHDPYSENAQYAELSAVKDGVFEVPDNRGSSLRDTVDGVYKAAMSRTNLEDPFTGTLSVKHPAKGSLIRPQYMVYAHYLSLKEKTVKCKNLTFFLPQEPLLRSACVSVYLDRIRDRQIDLVYVAQDDSWATGSKPGLINIALLSWWRDRWAFTSNESGQKGICHIGNETGRESFWLEHASYLSSWQYQHYFQCQFDHVIHDPRRKHRPGALSIFVDIYRAWHNLCWVDRSGKSPAQKLGVADAPLTLAELLR